MIDKKNNEMKGNVMKNIVVRIEKFATDSIFDANGVIYFSDYDCARKKASITIWH